MAYTIDGAIAASGLARTRLYLLIAAGTLTAKKSGRRTLIEGQSLRAYLDSLPVADIRVGARRAAEGARDAA